MKTGLLFEKALKAAENYQISTGIPCTVVDTSGMVVSGLKEYSICRQCRVMQRINKEIVICEDIHRYGIYQAEKFGGKYSYFCSFSLMYWVSPLLSNNIVKGGLVCGPVLSYDPDNFHIDEFVKKYQHQPFLQSFKDTLATLPNIDFPRAASLAELLFIVSSQVSDTHFPSVERKKTSEQQTEISDYLKYIKTMECNPEYKHRYPIEKERELLNLIAHADLKGARKILNEILGSVFFSNGTDFEIIKSRVLELVVLLSRAALEGGADVEQIFGLNYQYLNSIHGFKKIEELSCWLSNIMTRFTDLVFTLKSVKHTDAIYKAVHFINENFAEKITLDDVAEVVFLSPAYFSKIFKEQTDYNFTQYLNKVRIERSKALLKNSRISLVDIAGIVGYEDQSYFSKVFKKLTGVSPGKYRDTRGLEKGRIDNK